MKEWAKEWLDGERAKGVKRLEIKMKGNNHYVYESTTHWDKNLKKAVKTSKYIGKLDRDKGLILSRTKRLAQMKSVPAVETNPTTKMISLPEKSPSLNAEPISTTAEIQEKLRSVEEYGNSILIDEAMKDLKPILKDAFPDNWREIYAVAKIRICGNVPLKRIKTSWEKLYDAESLKPNLNPESVSNLLHTVGVDRIGQDVVFRRLLDHSEQLIYDLTTIFSRSMSIRQAEKGYNKDHIHLPQINLALLCSADTGLPTMIKSVPGSVRDVKTISNTISELDIEKKILIMDRGFFSEKVIEELESLKIKYVLPARRNSSLYNHNIDLVSHFTYHKRLIRYGKLLVDGRYLYQFEDMDLQLEETKTLYSKLDDGKIDNEKLNEKLKKAGMILILSSMDLPPTEIYELYKKRERVEKMFDSYKNVLDADRLYLQDDESVFGHVFISFLSLYGYCKIESMLKKAELSRKMSPLDLLLMYSKIYRVDLGRKVLFSEIPKKVSDLEEKLGWNIFPKN